MTLPAAIAAYGWIPFAAILMLIFAFAVAFIRYYQSRIEFELSASIIAVFSLTFTLATCALLPIDVFIVSMMKKGNGTFQDWASDRSDRESIEDGIMYAYYALYGMITIMAFMVLPFAYFYYEERDDDRPWRSRSFHAFKYSLGFTIFAGIALLTGAFIPLNESRDLNGTAWEKLEDLVKSIEKNGGEDAISFIISILCLVGIVFNIIYTGYGMGGWPIQLLKGSPSARNDYENVIARRNQLRRDYDSTNSRASPSIRNRQLAETERLLARQERELEEPANSRMRACLGVIWRPVELLLGFILLLLGGLLFISLFLTNVDRAMHGYMKMAYLLPYSNRTLPNPVDWILVNSQKVFPLDFVLYGVVVVFLMLATIMAVRSLGIRCLCIKLFRIRPWGTHPQGILFLCFILVFSVLGLNVILYFLSPQYSTFGNEHYAAYTDMTTIKEPMISVLRPCEERALEDCVMTRNSFFLVRYFFKAWFFGACYYWFSWGILGMYLFGLVHALIKRSRTAVDEAEDDYDELE